MGIPPGEEKGGAHGSAFFMADGRPVPAKVPKPEWARQTVLKTRIFFGMILAAGRKISPS
jgi:hypothetical protein